MFLPAPAPSIQPDPTEINLLTSADPLPAGVASYDRWRTGLAQRHTYTVATGTWPVDCVSEDEKDAIGETANAVSEFFPVSLYSHHGCAGRVDVEAYRAEAIARVEQATPYLLAQELWTGTVSGNPSLQSTGFDLTPFVGSDLTPAEGVAALLGAFETVTAGAKTFVHVPQPIVFDLIDKVLVTRQGNRLVTANGHVIIPGPGYPVAPGSHGPAGSDPADAGEFWIYATGCVEVGVHTTFTTGAEDNAVGGYARQNLVEYYAERLAIYRFPPTVMAIKVRASWYAAGS